MSKLESPADRRIFCYKILNTLLHTRIEAFYKNIVRPCQIVTIIHLATGILFWSCNLFIKKYLPFARKWKEDCDHPR